MTPKEKAIELYQKFYYQLPSNLSDKIQDCVAQECALIAVDEIIYYLEITLGVDKEDFEYWQEVKQEIEKL